MSAHPLIGPPSLVDKTGRTVNFGVELFRLKKSLVEVDGAWRHVAQRIGARPPITLVSAAAARERTLQAF